MKEWLTIRTFWVGFALTLVLAIAGYFISLGVPVAATKFSYWHLNITSEDLHDCAIFNKAEEADVSPAAPAKPTGE